MLFYDYKFSKMGYTRKMRVFFISIVLFYDHKSSKMGISKILNNSFIWFFFIIINFEKWVYKAMRVFFACCFNILIGIWHIRYFFFTFYPAIIWTWETSLEDWKMLIRWCRTDICSCKLSAKVSLMLDNPFLVPSLCKLNHISVCFIQISTKSPANSLFSSWKAMFFLKPSPVFWAAR